MPNFNELTNKQQELVRQICLKDLTKLNPKELIQLLTRASEDSLKFGKRSYSTFQGYFGLLVGWSTARPTELRTALTTLQKDCETQGLGAKEKRSRSYSELKDLLLPEIKAPLESDPSILPIEYIDLLLVGAGYEFKEGEFWADRAKAVNKIYRARDPKELWINLGVLSADKLEKDVAEVRARIELSKRRADAEIAKRGLPDLDTSLQLLETNKSLFADVGLDQRTISVSLDLIDEGGVELEVDLCQQAQNIANYALSRVNLFDDGLLVPSLRPILGPKISDELDHLIAAWEDNGTTKDLYLKRVKLAASAGLQGIIKLCSEDPTALQNSMFAQVEEKVVRNYTRCPICGGQTAPGDRCRVRCFEAD